MQQDVAVSAYLDEYLRVAEIADYGPQDCKWKVVTRLSTASRLLSMSRRQLLLHRPNGERTCCSSTMAYWAVGRTHCRAAGERGTGVNQPRYQSCTPPICRSTPIRRSATMRNWLAYWVTVETWWCEKQGTKIGVLGDFGSATPLIERSSTVAQCWTEYGCAGVTRFGRCADSRHCQRVWHRSHC